MLNSHCTYAIRSAIKFTLCYNHSFHPATSTITCSCFSNRFQTKWEPKRYAAPEDVRRVVADELDKLSGLEPVSPEFNVTRNYLEWLTALPWGQLSQEIFDIEHARTVRMRGGAAHVLNCI